MGFLVAALPIIAGLGAGVAQGVGLIGSATGLAAGLSTAAEVASAAGAVTGAIGAEETASAQQNAASYQSQVAANNSQIALNQAQQAQAAGETQLEAQGLKERATIGALTAAQAASNIDVNSGSALDVRSSAAALGQLDALTIRSNAEKQVYGDLTNAQSFASQSKLSAYQASQAPIAGAINANTSLVSGATGVSNQYLQWQKAYGASQTAQTLPNSQNPFGGTNGFVASQFT